MKNFIQATALCSIFPAFCFASINPAHTVQQTENTFFEPRANFERIWVDYDVTEEGYKGMRIHVKFTAYEMYNMDAYVAIYFEYNDATAASLRDKNNRYNSTDGDVAVYKNIKPQYDPAVYDDLQLFMPYSELDLAPGNYKLTMDVKIIYKQGGLISKLTKNNFEYTKPENSSGATTNFGKVWIDYDVYENGSKGMRIHVNFTVNQMKGQDCYLLITFEKKDGEKYYYMTARNNGYANLIGDLITFQKLTPCCDVANYDDLKLFMPYDEINLSGGRYDLRMDLDVTKSIDDDDSESRDFIGHLNYYTFWYNNN